MLYHLIVDIKLFMRSQNTPPKLFDQVRDLIRIKHYSIRTEQLYVQRIKRFILFHGKRHPIEIGSEEVETFLTHLAAEGNVSAADMNTASVPGTELYGGYCVIRYYFQ